MTDIIEIDWDKALAETREHGQCVSYETRDGMPVRIYANDGSGTFLHHCAYYNSGNWWAETYNENGEATGFLSKTDRDIIPKPTSGEVWVNVYKRDDCIWFGQGWSDRTKADAHITGPRIACIRSDWKDGQFDNETI